MMLNLLSSAAVGGISAVDLARINTSSASDSVNYSEYCPDNKVYIRLAFTQTFKIEYLRNNKCNGTKNIRCFPCCTEPAHSTQGFCGQPVYAHCTIIR